MSDLKKIFPFLDNRNHKITSSRSAKYNCIAWAASDIENWWWPRKSEGYYWPSDVPWEETLSSFQKAFQKLGFEVCENSDLENGFEKIALFADEYNKPKHAALQMSNGRWSSKCGKLEDIEHDLTAIQGNIYGNIKCYMKRPCTKNKYQKE